MARRLLPLIFFLLSVLSSSAQWCEVKLSDRYTATAVVYRGSNYSSKFILLGNDNGDFGQPMITLFDMYGNPVENYGDMGTAKPDMEVGKGRLLQGAQVANDNTVFMGIRKTNDSSQPFLLMLDMNGKPVQDFGNNGKVFLPFACSPYQKIVMRITNDRILVCGADSKTIAGKNNTPFLFFACYDMNGKPVQNFGMNGYAEWYDLNGPFGFLDMGDCLLNPDGSVVCAAATRLRSNEGVLVLLQLDATGKIKPSAGKDYQLYWKESEVFKVERVLSWTNNRFVVFRHRFEPSGTYTLFDICAFQQDGTIDPSFGENGLKRISTKYGNKAVSQDLLVRSDGRLRLLFAARNKDNENNVFVQSLGLTEAGNRDYDYTPGGVAKLNLNFDGNKNAVRFVDNMYFTYMQTDKSGASGGFLKSDIGDRVEAASNDYAMFEARYEGAQTVAVQATAAKSNAPVAAEPPRDASKDNLVIEETFSNLEKCLNDWGNDMKKRMELVSQIGNCGGDADCLGSGLRRLKSHLSGMQSNINNYFYNHFKSFKPSWNSCSELGNQLLSFSSKLGNAETHYEMAAGTAGNTIQYISNRSEYAKMVQILFMQYDKADVSFQEAFEEIAKAYDTYKKKTCSNLKPSASLLSGNTIRESLNNWQEALGSKINEMAKKEQEEDAARQKAAETKKAQPGVCASCKGSGYEPEYKSCWFCGGDGVTTEIVTGEKTIGTKRVYKGTNSTGTEEKYELRDVKSMDIKGKKEITCSQCKGAGKIKTGKKITCHVCNGSGKS